MYTTAEIDKAKTVFFNNVSHEFRTPLTLMLGPLEEAIVGGSKSLQGDSLQIVYRNCTRLLKLVNTLLDFSRAEAGRIEASFTATNLFEFTKYLASNFSSAVRGAGLKYVITGENLTEPVYVDPEMWEKIVLNLISNALKFTFEGEIGVHVRQVGGHAELIVKDTGTGIPAQEIPNLFKRFHRVQGAKSRSYEGSGIGLALVNDLSKLNGGTIEVKSEMGVGTEFTVRVPMGTNHLPKEQINMAAHSYSSSRRIAAYTSEAASWTGPKHLEEIEPIIQNSLSSAKIIVVDDNSDMRQYLKGILSPRWQVKMVSNGIAALEAVRQEIPDLILSDVMMPEMNGFQLLAALRKDKMTNKIPIILLSARAGEEATVEGLASGADDYLVKPFSARELVARVNTHLTMGGLRREISEQQTKLIHSLKMSALGEMAGGIAHEINNPLAIIAMRTGQLKELVVSDEFNQQTAVNWAEKIEATVERITKIIKGLRAFAREAEHDPYFKSSVKTIIDDTLSLCTEKFKVHGIEIVFGECSSKLFIDCRATQICQVLLNLLNNAHDAVKNCPEKWVKIEVVEDVDTVEISVTDSGTGMTSELRDKVMMPFFTTKEIGKGMGLGLSISKGIIESHHGKIEIDSKCINTRFFIVLPKAQVVKAVA